MSTKSFRAFLFSVLTLAVQSTSSATDGPKLPEILNKHWEAMGGMQNWLKVESIQLNGTIEREGQVVDLVIVKKRPDKIRATITLPIPGSEDEKLQVIRAHDGKTGWTATRMAGAPEMHREELPSAVAAELLADAGVLPPLIKLWRQGAELELMEFDEFEENADYVIEAKLSEQELKYIFYLDRKTYRLSAYETHNEAGIITRTTLEDYASDSGIYIAKKSIIKSPDTGRSVIQTQSIQIGVGIYREYFSHTAHAVSARSD